MVGRQDNLLIFLNNIQSGQVTLRNYIVTTIRFLQRQLAQRIQALTDEVTQLQYTAVTSESSVACIKLTLDTLIECISNLEADKEALERRLKHYQALQHFTTSNGTVYFYSDEIQKIKSIFSRHMLFTPQETALFQDLDLKIDLLVCHAAISKGTVVDNYKHREGRVYVVFPDKNEMHNATNRLDHHFGSETELFRFAKQANTIELLSPAMIEMAKLLTGKSSVLTLAQ